MDVLVLGNVVRWTRGKGTGLGVVDAVTGDEVTIRFDDPEDARKTFRWPTDVLERVVYQPGKFVHGVADGVTGMVTFYSFHQQLAIYQVSQPDGTMRTVLETGLRPAHLMDPAALIASGEIHDGRSTNLRIAATRLFFAQQYEELAALSNSRVEIKPHQVAVLHRAATTYPHRFLLADEVGLGKTIEAGLIIKELKARGVADRVLILAPSGIVSQWQYELKSKFNETFSRYTRETTKYLEGKHPGENVWTLEPNVITSTSYAAWDEARRRDIALAGWDLVVIDEAHHVRRTFEGQNRHSETQLYKLGAALAEAGETRAGAMLLLTATPMQLHPFELYSLIELLDPTLFPDYGEFEAHRQELAGLNRALDRALEWPKLDRREQEKVSEEVARWLDTAPDSVAELLGTASGRESAADALREKHRVSEVMIRNRKAVVGGFRGRVPHVIPVRMTEAERTAYAEVSAYAQHGYRRSKETGNQALGFLMAIFQKLNSSSSHALRRSLLRRIERLEEERVVRDPELPDEEEQSEAILGEGADWIALEADVERIEELLELRRLVGLLDSIEVDSKARALRQQLEAISEAEPGAKVVVFTQFRDTQSYLVELLSSSWDVNVFHGQLNPEEKDRAVERFREGARPQLLISTEAGGEGRNFQFCHYLVNYDLPWNPMRVEQRIGRLDRIGQKETVKVFNFAIEGTIEERVLEVLTRRIRLFEETIGSLDPILGDAIEADIRDVLLTAHEESDRAVRQLEAALEDRIRQAEQVEARLADMIMDTRSFRRDDVEALLERRQSAIGPESMSRFVISALRELEVDCSPAGDIEGVWNIAFRGRSLTDLDRFVQEGRKWRVTFDPAVALNHEELDFLAFGHPLVDELVTRVRARGYGGRTSHRVVASEGFEPQQGWFFVFALEFEGVVASKQLLPVYVSLDGAVDEGIASWLYERSVKLKRDGSSDHVVPIDSFPAAQQTASTIAVGHLLTRKLELGDANRARLEQERAKLERFYAYKERAACDKLESVGRTLERLEASESPEERRILPVWQKNLEDARRRVDQLGAERERRLRDLIGRDEVSASNQLVAASFVEIVLREPPRAPL